MNRGGEGRGGEEREGWRGKGGEGRRAKERGGWGG